MLAKSYDDVKNKIVFPCHVQPKLDGMRCHMNQYKVISRDNKVITTMDHIHEHIINDELNTILDGELYAHGLSFQENMKLIKKQRPESKLVNFHVYDLAIGDNLSFEYRYKGLQGIVKRLNTSTIKLVPTYLVNNMDDVRAYHAQFLKDGYEGTIIRWGTAAYKFNGRSDNLVKYKDFKDIALIIKDIVPMETMTTHGLIVCEMNGQEFKATPKMSHKEREELLTNKDKHIGKIAEIRYFEETDSGLPRFPVFVGFR
jgi:DNA ligase 1